MAGTPPLDILREAMEQLDHGRSRVYATWRTVHQGQGAREELHVFRGTGPMLNFQRNAAGVFELP